MIRTLLLTALFALAVAASAVVSSHAATKAGVEAQFRQWLETDLWPEARRAGVSRPVFDRAFSGVSLNWDLPDLAPPGFPKPKQRAQSQAEFRSPGAYFSEKRLQGLTSSGRSLMKQHASLLRRIEDRYGVPASIIVAIWGRESGFGRAKIPHSAVEVIATKAFMSTRPELFRKEMNEGRAGDNVGCLLRGVKREDIQRGQCLAKPKSINPHTVMNRSQALYGLFDGLVGLS